MSLRAPWLFARRRTLILLFWFYQKCLTLSIRRMNRLSSAFWLSILLLTKWICCVTRLIDIIFCWCVLFHGLEYFTELSYYFFQHILVLDTKLLMNVTKGYFKFRKNPKIFILTRYDGWTTLLSIILFFVRIISKGYYLLPLQFCHEIHKKNLDLSLTDSDSWTDFVHI